MFTDELSTKGNRSVSLSTMYEWSTDHKNFSITMARKEYIFLMGLCLTCSNINNNDKNKDAKSSLACIFVLKHFDFACFVEYILKIGNKTI
jgi:hypothetical protein